MCGGEGELIYEIDLGVVHQFSHPETSGERKIEVNMESLGERPHFDPKL